MLSCYLKPFFLHLKVTNIKDWPKIDFSIKFTHFCKLVRFIVVNVFFYALEQTSQVNVSIRLRVCEFVSVCVCVY